MAKSLLIKCTFERTTQAVARNRIEIIAEDDIEGCLGTIMNEATFIGRGFKYGTVKVRFVTKEAAASHATKISRSKKVNLLPAYTGSRSVRVRVGRI